MSKYDLENFPPKAYLESEAVLRILVSAHRFLAELKGVARTIPNERLLISTLTLQEAQSSSEIESIITTQDALYKFQLQPQLADPISKEVFHYAKGLDVGFAQVEKNGLLTLNCIQDIQTTLVGNVAGFRKTPGTKLINEKTGETVYEPPLPDKILTLMKKLETFIHEDNPLDPLVRMALIHHQFENIHPFYDGNGRTGRIINILYLVKEGLLDTPILYLSRYISQTKFEYYQALQAVRERNDWEPWLLYLIRGIALTARHTTRLVENIGSLLQNTKHSIRANYRFYSQDLINNLFRHPYTKVAFLKQDLDVSRQTATRYLDLLARDGILLKKKLGRENYYINQALIELLFHLPELGENSK